LEEVHIPLVAPGIYEGIEESRKTFIWQASQNSFYLYRNK
jgi:hypothetical protein